MNKTALVVVGALAVAGVGAYFYFKPKKATETTSTPSMADSLATSQISVPPTGTTLTDPKEVAETAKKIADAKALAKQIVDLKKQKEALQTKLYTTNTPSGTFGTSSLLSAQLQATKNSISAIDKKINDLNKLINDLGYAELNGGVVKIL